MTIVLNHLKGGVIQLIKPSSFIDELPAIVKMIHQNLHLTLIEVLQQTLLDVVFTKSYSYYGIYHYFVCCCGYSILSFYVVKSKEKTIKIPMA